MQGDIQVAETLTIPYEWLKQLDPAVFAADKTPLLGHPLPFPYDKFADALAKNLELKDCQIRCLSTRWVNAEQLTEGLAAPVIPLSISVSPLAGELTWLFAHQDVAQLMAKVLKRKEELFADQEFENGFYKFIALEALSAFNAVVPDRSILPHLTDQAELPNTLSLCRDFVIAIEGAEFFGRLVIPQVFHQSWCELFAERQTTSPLDEKIAEHLALPVALEAGKTSLTYEELSSLQLGDFIVLDTCTMDPIEQKGRVILSIHGHPLFRARFKQHELRILEFPLYQEAPTAMEKHPEDHEEEVHDEETHSEDSDFDFHDEDFNFDEDFDENEELTQEEQIYEDTTPLSKPEQPAQQLSPQTAASAAAGHEQEPKQFSAGEVPLNLIVEAGRITIPIKKLLELQPGNVLELNIKPEDGVNLVINGKIIGKGELLKVGEVLGVRILDLG